MTSNNQDMTEEQNNGVEAAGDSIEVPKHQPPKTSATTNDEPSFGWSGYAERVNGRFAMIGFIIILLIEALSKTSFLHWAGIFP